MQIFMNISLFAFKIVFNFFEINYIIRITVINSGWERRCILKLFFAVKHHCAFINADLDCLISSPRQMLRIYMPLLLWSWSKNHMYIVFSYFYPILQLTRGFLSPGILYPLCGKIGMRNDPLKRQQKLRKYFLAFIFNVLFIFFFPFSK